MKEVSRGAHSKERKGGICTCHRSLDEQLLQVNTTLFSSSWGFCAVPHGRVASPIAKELSVGWWAKDWLKHCFSHSCLISGIHINGVMLDKCWGCLGHVEISSNATLDRKAAEEAWALIKWTFSAITAEISDLELQLKLLCPYWYRFLFLLNSFGQFEFKKEHLPNIKHVKCMFRFGSWGQQENQEVDVSETSCIRKKTGLENTLSAWHFMNGKTTTQHT